MYPKQLKSIIFVFLILVLFLTACAPESTPEAESEANAQPPEAAVPTEAAQPTEAVVPTEAAIPTETVAPKGPTVGGTLVLAMNNEPDTLDPHRTGSAASCTVTSLIGASLVTKDVDGNYVPYLAESWEVSDDGLTWTFVLKEGVKFHDGNPLTAQDYAWTINRVLDPETGAAAVAGVIAGVTSAEALDDQTLVLNTSAPSFYLLDNLTLGCYTMPLEKSFVESMEDDLSRNLIGVGPYMLKEWLTGDRVVLERNPDFTWGPEYAHAGPFYIEEIEFRIIPEYSTILAGLEANEISQASVQPQDLQRIQETGNFQIFEGLGQGPMTLIMNNTFAPFDDINVRQAINYAVDKNAVVQVVLQGNGIPAYGILTPSIPEYWTEVDQAGYHYDPDKATQLLLDAGYTPGSDGIMEKDGVPLQFNLLTPVDIDNVKTAEVIQQQLKAVGIGFEIEQNETSNALTRVFTADFEAALIGWGYPNADILYLLFHSSMKGAYGDLPVIDDPVLDSMLDQSRSTTDPAAHQQLVIDIAQYIIDNAFMAPIYVQKTYLALNNSIQGALYSPLTGILYNDAYFVSP